MGLSLSFLKWGDLQVVHCFNTNDGLPILGWFGGFLKWRYPQFLSIYRWIFHEINNPAMGIPPSYHDEDFRHLRRACLPPEFHSAPPAGLCLAVLLTSLLEKNPRENVTEFRNKVDDFMEIGKFYS